MRSRASRRRLSDNDIRCSASDRRWFPARPAQHVHRRRYNGKGRIPSAIASAHGRNGKRRVETCNAGRAGAHRRSEALHPTRSSDVLPRIARERVPTVLLRRDAVYTTASRLQSKTTLSSAESLNIVCQTDGRPVFLRPFRYLQRVQKSFLAGFQLYDQQIK